MKTKLQIFLESFTFFSLFGILSGFGLYLSNLINKESIILGLILTVFALVGTCLILPKIFEKEEIYWKSFLKYLVIGITSILFSVTLALIGMPFIFDWAMDSFTTYWKSLNFGAFESIFLFFPMLIVFICLVIGVVFFFMAVIYMLGTWFFTFLFHWIWNEVDSKK
ncbi:MAG: hypothetical protein SFU98_09735 [Leptospiraceae bacterium]|nr:hypothetical protein [Leptospiraceae bacterium]